MLIKRKTLTQITALVLAISCLVPMLVSCKKKPSNDESSTQSTKKDFNDFIYSGEKLTLLSPDMIPTLYIDQNDTVQSIRAISDLQKDFERISGKKPSLVSNENELTSASLPIIVGTLGKSSLVDRFEKEGIINLDNIKGQWEAYKICIVENPVKGIEKALIIAGSDKRGTVFGIYELSELIGVSPWYYWGDVEIEHADTIELPVEKLTQTEMPDVKYRGIFLNDEENLAEWSKQFITKKGGEQGTFNSVVYAKIFELMLRLKANTLWPAMHACSDAFNEYKNPKTGVSYNAELADKYGIVMSSSHCELLLRDNEGEWQDWCIKNSSKYNMTKNENWRKSYDFTLNPEGMKAYWEERVAENYRFENIYMIGLRGVHDSSVNCVNLKDTSTAGKAGVVKAAVEAQLEILEKYEKKLAKETGEEVSFQTAYCPYKEAADYLSYDISLPDDCFIVYSDDNHGYVRAAPTDADKKKYGGFGAYYHLSVWGCPSSYLWLCHTPLTIMAEEMRRAYYSGTDDCWIVNVGDIKPAEFQTEYFLKLGWDIEKYTEQNTEEYSAEFLMQNFGLDPESAKKQASMLTDLYQIMRNYYPENIDTYIGQNNEVYSVSEYGSEGLIVLYKVTEICKQSEKLMNSLPKGKRDSYYEMFHYTVYSYMLLLQKHVYKEMNLLCYEQGRYACANAYADLSEKAYQLILDEVAYYNKQLANGKWNKIMNPYNSEIPMPPAEPQVKRYPITSDSFEGVGVFAEGERDASVVPTLSFGSLNDNIRFIDVFAYSSKEQSFAITAPSYVIVKDSSGKALEGTKSGENTVYDLKVTLEERYHISIDWSSFSPAEYRGSVLSVSSLSGTSNVNIEASKHALDPSREDKKGYYEENGLISIEAEHFSSNVSANSFKWVYIDGLGRSGGCMMALSEGENPFENTKISSSFDSKSPYMEYNIYFTNTGKYSCAIYRLQTLDERAVAKHTTQIGWSIDNGSVKLIKCVNAADDKENSPWGNGVKNHIEKLEFTLTISEAGWHSFRIYMASSLQAVDKIVLNMNDVVSRLDAPESYNSISFERAPISHLPSLTYKADDAVDIQKKDYFVLYDANPAGKELQSGYLELSNNKGSIMSKGWEWLSNDGITAALRTSGDKAPIVDKGFIYKNGSSTLKLKVPFSGEYGINISVGDIDGTVKASNMKVLQNGNVLIEGINTSGKGIYHYGFNAYADENGIIELTFEGAWIISSLEIFSYNENPQTGSGAFKESTGSNVVIECESALENSSYAWSENSSDGKGYSWSYVSGVYGGALFSGPNAGQSYSDSNPESSKAHKLHYTVELGKGTYKVYALIKSSGANDDSVFVSLDGQKAINLNLVDESDGYIWVEIGSVTSTKSGEQILTLMGREDGIVMDRIILVQNGKSVLYDAPAVRK